MTQTNTYDPENWLLSTTRALKEYVENAFNDAYKVVMEFPSTDEVLETMPLDLTIIHFEIDDQDHRRLGFGDNYGAINYDAGTHQSNPQEAAIRILNFDVGVWASDRSGGVTSRLRAQQTLGFLFEGSLAQAKLDAAVDAGDGRIEILNYRGGRSLTDKINDVDVYRMVDATLEIRVFSRTPLVPLEAVPALEVTNIDDNLEIDGATIN
jgi:hypothetical protein